MIKFFRHIRQRLVADNKFSKYLIYTIGEIILVVIDKTILCPVRDNIRVAIFMKQNPRAVRYEILYAEPNGTENQYNNNLLPM